MKLCRSIAPIATGLLLGLGSLNAHAKTYQCREIGGMGLANAVDETHQVGALTGKLRGGARAKITSQVKTATGIDMGMEHCFLTDKGGALLTRDKATLTTVPGKASTYMLAISYDVVEAHGIYAGYEGQFKSFGLIDLGAGKVALRYNGEICKEAD